MMMKIGEVAKRSKLPASTLRFYEEQGLICSIGRKGLTRLFAPDVIQQLALISLGRKAGLSLPEIKNMLLADGLAIDRELLLSKADQLDKQISEMIAIRDGLRHAAACKAPSHLACPTFLRLLKLASKRWTRSPTKLRR